MILERLARLLDALGLENAPPYASRLALAALIVLLSWIVYLIVRRIVVRALHAVAARTRVTWDDVLFRTGVLERLSLLAPALVVYSSASLLFPGEDEQGAVELVQRLANVWMVMIGAQAASRLFDAVGAYAREQPATRDKPIRSYLQVAKIVIWIAVAIASVATLMDRSPWAILTGLGALTAVLLLVFRDSILGFLASIQISGYDLVRVGEWIEVPAYGADGEVVDISLHTVRVRNWDKTIVILPTTALLSEGFKNWRGMTESGGRRIKRALLVDMGTVRFLEPEELARLEQVGILTPYLERKKREIEEWNAAVPEGDQLRRRRLTNLGTFRAYVEAYLRHHPEIRQDMTFLVRQLAPGADGMPIEIYVFSKEQRWDFYEGIVADVFDHLLAALPAFGLAVFQQPSGTDVRTVATALGGAGLRHDLPVDAGLPQPDEAAASEAGAATSAREP
ncbi:MAG TPA: mechanosensitive ion channel domain-containing protein [Thermoanaerobaculia bacterium]|nr:mechanosensitive ion channel domain-containing protein [Thermoanaerobaculia bacterium]